jgi:hypothetical protein
MVGSSFFRWSIFAASHGVSRHFEDSNSKDQGGYWLPLNPSGVCTPCGCSSYEPFDWPKPIEGPPCASAPLQRHVSTAPHRAVGDASSPGLSCPTTHAGPATLLWGSGSPRHRAPRPRFGYLPRGIHRRSSRRRSAGASMGFALQGLLLVCKRCPSRGPCPPDVTRIALIAVPKGTAASEPPTGPRACDEFVLSPSDRSRSTVDAFLSFSPSERSPHTAGLSLLVTMPALSSLGGVTSLPAWTTGLRGKCESAGPSPSCQLS